MPLSRQIKAPKKNDETILLRSGYAADPAQLLSRYFVHAQKRGEEAARELMPQILEHLARRKMSAASTHQAQAVPRPFP